MSGERLGISKLEEEFNAVHLQVPPTFDSTELV